MNNAIGYVLVLDEDRAEVFDGSLQEYGEFAEPVPDFQRSRTAPLVVLVSTESGEITHLADGRGGVRAGTDRRRLNLRDIHTIRTPVPVGALIERVDRNVRGHVRIRLESGGVLPPRSFDAVVAAMLELAPDSKAVLDRYSAARRAQIASLSRGVRNALGAQKEAVNTALHIAGIDRSVLARWSPEDMEETPSFLGGISEARIIEDHMIWNDQSTPFPGFSEIKRSITGTARFENNEIALEVIVANRAALEKQTGADLIYWNATFRSFVLVQYKVMERDRQDKESVFRLPEAKLTDELSRMDALLFALRTAAPPSHRDHYRLNDNPFFLKLCPRIIFDPDSASLTPGMYFPLALWRHVEADRDMVGPRGGRIVTYRNVRRHITNTDFAAMVSGAWVGTTPRQAAILGPIIEEILREGRAAVIAVGSDKRLAVPDDD